MKKKILSWLLHHANRKYSTDWFYSIKKELLKKYGKHDGYDCQFIEGKRCYTCNGTGVYVGYYYSGGSFKDTCNRCWGNGFYRDPQWNVLERLKFGQYTFHQPFERCRKKPEIPVTIDGYVSHHNSYWTNFASILFCLLFNFKGYGRQWTLGLGGGWYNKINNPKAFISNVCHILRFDINAIPFQKYRRRFNKPQPTIEYDNDDLPF